MSLLIKRTTLAHKLFCDITIYLTDSFRFFPALLYLSSTTPFYASVVSKAAAGMIFTPLVWCGCRIRTCDLPLQKRALYQLSYRGSVTTEGHN